MTDRKLTGTFNEEVLAPALSADPIIDQYREILADNGIEAQKTLRRPDMRLIVRNTSAGTIQFQDPGDLSGGAPQVIPAGEAVMVMVTGETLEEQRRNAKELFDSYGLAARGLNEDFLKALADGSVSGLVQQAYGPAPFDGQVGKLAPLNWTEQNGAKVDIAPQVGANAAYGLRPPSEEEVIELQHPAIRIAGTSTTAEIGEAGGINVAIDGAGSTRPIVPSVAKEFYGDKADKVPEVIVDHTGKVLGVELNDDGVILVDRNPHVQAYKKPTPKGPS